MEARPPRRVRVPWFEAKLVGTLLLALSLVWFAAVYLFGQGIRSSFSLILQPSIADGLRTAKERTHDHIEALREQLKWRAERMASELRRQGPGARVPGRLEVLLQRLVEEDAAAFSGHGAEAEGGAAGVEEAGNRRARAVLVDLSAVDATGRRVHVRAPDEYPDAAWRVKTFRPRPPADKTGARAAAIGALEAPLLCVLGACEDGGARMSAGVQVAKTLLRMGEGGGAAAELDAAGLEAVFATPWALFEGLQELSDVLDRYKMLRMAGEEIRRRFGWVYMIILGVAATLTLGVSILFARRVTRRVAAIARATRQVATGDLDVRIVPAGRDEIAELARSFNEMVADLRESRDRIAYLSRVSAWQGIARRLAHEIKNPLTPIQLAIQQVAEKYEGGDEQYGKLVQTAREVIEEEVATLRRLTTEFSAFARLPQVQPVPTDLGEFLDDCRAAFGGAAAEQGVDLEWHSPARPLTVPLDRQMMRRVIDNLVRNALEALAGEGGAAAGRPAPRIAVEADLRPGGARARIVVRDNGPGIPSDAREHIFEPYFTTKPTGTGLGLAIVKKIVLEHAGEIEVDSSPEGSVFRIELPLAGAEHGGRPAR
ncbi:MAG: HAMP domain-containing protein [Deltaproteobacteria bacterium]|nr:HAMP domain-containing protein [Deltaproteobacteria bacterium]